MKTPCEQRSLRVVAKAEPVTDPCRDGEDVFQRAPDLDAARFLSRHYPDVLVLEPRLTGERTRPPGFVPL